MTEKKLTDGQLDKLLSQNEAPQAPDTLQRDVLTRITKEKMSRRDWRGYFSSLFSSRASLAGFALSALLVVGIFTYIRQPISTQNNPSTINADSIDLALQETIDKDIVLLEISLAMNEPAANKEGIAEDQPPPSKEAQDIEEFLDEILGIESREYL